MFVAQEHGDSQSPQVGQKTLWWLVGQFDGTLQQTNWDSWPRRKIDRFDDFAVLTGLGTMDLLTRKAGSKDCCSLEFRYTMCLTTRNKCHASSNRCLTSSNKKLLETSVLNSSKIFVSGSRSTAKASSLFSSIASSEKISKMCATLGPPQQLKRGLCTLWTCGLAYYRVVFSWAQVWLEQCTVLCTVSLAKLAESKETDRSKSST